MSNLVGVHIRPQCCQEFERDDLTLLCCRIDSRNRGGLSISITGRNRVNERLELERTLDSGVGLVGYAAVR